jgi:hypothetical protein
MTTSSPSERGRDRHVLAFLVLAFGWTWAFWVPEALVAEGVLDTIPALPGLGPFGPTVAGFALVAYADGFGGVRRLLARAVQVDYPKRWLVVALALPPVVVLASLGVGYATGATFEFPWAGEPIVLAFAFVFIFFLGGPVQEEFGWRGYLLDPVQARLGALGGGLAVGVVWSTWHVPLFFIPSQTIYYQEPFLGFLAGNALVSVLITWVYNNTNASLLPALLLHTSFNWANGMFPILTDDTASLAMLALFALVVVAVAAYAGPGRLARDSAGERA